MPLEANTKDVNTSQDRDETVTDLSPKVAERSLNMSEVMAKS